jgi:glutamate racemase
VFDSGSGGLTVLAALQRRLPGHRFVYLGDHGHAPYGERSPEEIYGLSLAGTARLFELGCPLVLFACNTAAAVALRRLQQAWLPHSPPGRRVLGVLVPVVEELTGVAWQAAGPDPHRARPALTVGVLATRRTVESGAYAVEVAKRLPGARVVQQACPGLVDAIEAGAPTGALVRRAVAGLLAQTAGQAPDAVVLGCTHYPLVRDQFEAALPAGVRLVDQAALVAESLARYLDRHPEFAATGRGEPSVRYLTTGEPAGLDAAIRRLLGAAPPFDRAPPLLAPEGEGTAAS